MYPKSVSEWLDFWLNTAIRNNIKSSTKASYESKIKNYITPFMGKQKLCLLEKAHINDLIRQLFNQNYSQNTVKTTISILKSSLNYAVQNEYLQQNPADNITIPSGNVRKIRALSIQQQRRLEERAFQEQGCSAVILSLSTGMRIGEICGLQWSDIDFVQDTIKVERTLQRISNSTLATNRTEILLSSPKTKSSVRKIPLPLQLKEYLLEKKAFALSSFVISYKGRHTEPRVITYRFKKMLKDSEIHDINFHSLRHTFATRCIENGIDIATVSKLLGHTSTKLTLDMYTDSLWENRKQAMSIIDAVMFQH